MLRRVLCDRSCFTLLSLLPILLSGCQRVESKHPLVDPDQAKFDSQLFGQWMMKERGETGHLLIGKANAEGIEGLPTGLMSGYDFRVSTEGEIKLSNEPICLFVAEVAGEKYLHLANDNVLDAKKFPKWDKANLRSCWIFKCAVDKGRLRLTPMNPDLAARAVESGKLKGEVRREKAKKDADNNSGEGKVQGVRLTDDTASLVRFLQNGGDKLLFVEKDSIVLTRVK